VLIGDTIFTSPTGDGTAILRGHPSHAKVYPVGGQREYLHFSVILRRWVRSSNGPVPGIEPATFRSAVKRSTDWANPAVDRVIKCMLQYVSNPEITKLIFSLARTHLRCITLINVLSTPIKFPRWKISNFTNIYSCHCRVCYLKYMFSINWKNNNILKMFILQVLVVMSIQVNRSCSRYITSMATLLLRWTSSQVVTVKLFTRVIIADQPLEDTTCTYPTTLEATAYPTPIVVTTTTLLLGTLHGTRPVNFLQDPTNSLPLMLKCFTRQQLKPCR